MRAFAKKLKNIYLLSFLIPVLGMLGIFIARGIFPFGNNSFMFSDMYHQYVPFLTEFWRKLHEGESLAFSWRVGLGSNFVALYAYYLASPENWLAFFCPEKYLIEFMTYIIVLKIGLMGLTFFLLLKQALSHEGFTHRLVLRILCHVGVCGSIQLESYVAELPVAGTAYHLRAGRAGEGG